MVQDRTERYSRIRAWLDYPFEQRPRPHQMLNQMLVDEQWMNLRLTNENESWSLLPPVDVSAVSGTSEYTITQPASGDFHAGKIYFVVRSTGADEEPYLPVQFEDYSQVAYGQLPTGMNNARAVIEKISVFRTGMQDQELKVAIYPTPQEALTYRIFFHTGQMDRLAAAMDSSGIVSELSDFIDLKSTLALLGYCEWYNDNDDRNERKMKRLTPGLTMQFEQLKPVVDDYISTINSPQDFDLGFAID